MRFQLASLSLLSVLLLSLMSVAAKDGDTNMLITIHRQYPAAACVSGYLAVNGQTIVYSLERPWVDNLNNISSIPSGKYSAHLRYDKNDHWRIELNNVPGRSGIQIHIGNQP